MATEKATSKDAQYVVASILPDVCLTPDKKDKPVPYPIIHKMDRSKQCSPNVFFEGEKAYLHEESYVAGVSGDEAGGGLGIVSNTHMKISRSIDQSRNVFVNGKRIVRTGDTMWMNRKEP
ncbi:MAG: DUF4150 domain-containing protein [Azoarcus sp.]|nr:DUF4150 domain-containing protein [Azoarcus sp.]